MKYLQFHLNQQFYKKLIKISTYTLTLIFVSLLNFNVQAQDEVAEAFTKPDDPDRITYLIDEIYAKMDFLASEYPQICTPKYSIGNTYDGNPIYALKISDNPSIDEDEQAVFYDSCHHGSEKFAMAATVNYMLWLCEQYYDNNKEVKYLIDNREIYIIPVVNVDGFIKSKRKNERPLVDSCQYAHQTNGVDLNRNYPVAFGLDPGSSTNECASNYCGEFPFSEPETQAVRDFVTTIKPTCAFSTHSAGGFVLIPSKNTPIPTSFDIYADMASEMYAENDYFYGTTATAINYRSAGTTRDYLHSLGIMAFTPEIRPTSGTINFDSIKTIVAENVRPMRILAWLSGAYPVVKNHTLGNVIPNSTFELVVEVKNKGKGLTAENVTATATSNNSNIRPIVSFTEYEQINSQAIQSNQSNPFKFSVNSAAQIGESAVIEIKVALNGVQTDLYKIPVVVGEKNILLAANAESVTANFTSRGDYGIEAGTEIPSTDAWGRDSADSYSGSYSFSESINGLSSANQTAYFTTQTIDLNNTTNPKMQFAAKWSIGHFSQVKLQAMYNNVWTDIEVYTGSSDWVFKIIDLSAYTQGNLKLRFCHTSGTSRIGDGFYFDDFEIVDYTEPKYITVNKPTAGDVFSPGEQISIEWEDNISENVQIRLYKNNLYWSLISYSTLSNGSFIYTIPENMAPYDRYRIRVSSVSTSTIIDYSDYFSIQTEITNQPDLTVNNCSVSISGNVVTINNVRVENIGTATAATSTLGYYFSSSDRAANFGDDLIATKEVPALASNGISTQSISINVSEISPPLPAGVYNVGVVADYDSNITEANENNNSCYDASPLFTVTVGCKNANAHNYDANATYNDNSLCENCTDGIQNGDETGVDCGGSKCAPCEGNSYITVNKPVAGDVFSPGEQISIEWEDNISENVQIRLYKNNLFWSLVSSSTLSNGSFIYTIPENMAPYDRYRIRVSSVSTSTIIDYSDYFSIQTEITNQPDLTVNNCSVSISGNVVTINNVRVENIGTATAATSTLGYYFSSSDRAANFGDDLIATKEVPALASNGISTQSISINVSEISPPLPAGVYNVGVVADYDDNITEANENNNSCYDASPLFTVTVGCKNANAHNYDANATYNDNSLCENCTDGIQNGDETGVDCGGSCPNSCLSNCQQTDRAALITLYNSTDGTNWKRKWNLNLPMNQWYGVELNEEGCVTEISLYGNRLNGFIPEELGSLGELRKLNFNNNALTGAIPGSLGNLKQLTELILSNCSLTGEIPQEFGDMERLENLYLYSNQLTGTLPSELGQLTQLKKLYVMNNNLSGCFEPGVITLCGQIQTNNYYINKNNSFDANWSDFCTIGTCYDRLASSKNLSVECYPNPFKDRAIISYMLNTAINVNVKVYNAAGEEIEILTDDKLQEKGRNTVVFDGTNYPAGVYYFSFESADHFEFRKMVLMK